MLQLKKDPWLLAAFTILAIGLGVLCYLKVITWQQLLVGLGALTAPSVLGRKDGDPPAGGATPLLVGLVLVCVFGLGACLPAQTPRETGRAVVLVVADAVKQLDTACAQVATAKHDAEIATKCADGYDAARYALIGAEAAIDNYDGSGAGELPCAVARAMTAAQAMVSAVQAAGGRIPPVVDDALRLAPLLTVACRA